MCLFVSVLLLINTFIGFFHKVNYSHSVESYLVTKIFNNAQSDGLGYDFVVENVGDFSAYEINLNLCFYFLLLFNCNNEL